MVMEINVEEISGKERPKKKKRLDMIANYTRAAEV